MPELKFNMAVNHSFKDTNTEQLTITAHVVTMIVCQLILTSLYLWLCIICGISAYVKDIAHIISIISCIII
ncbi:MAG: hypothetical protein ACOC2U_03335 [bacterium]